MLKNCTYVLLLVVLLLQAGGLLFIFNAEQGYVQHKMHKKLNSENTVFEKLTLTLAEFQKCRVNSSEVLFHDNMYDFKSVSFIGDKVELLVIHDKEEGIILEIIENLVNNTSPQSKDVPNQLQKLISLVYLPPVFYKLVFIPRANASITYPLQADIISYTREILSPPPRIA